MRTRLKPGTIDRARALRKHSTGAERKLWYMLRGLRAQGFHFRRQVPFRGYILDFVEHSARIVVELDGSQQAEPEQSAGDEARDRVLLSEGYQVLRFGNYEVLTNPWGLAQKIVAHVEERRRS